MTRVAMIPKGIPKSQLNNPISTVSVTTIRTIERKGMPKAFNVASSFLLSNTFIIDTTITRIKVTNETTLRMPRLQSSKSRKRGAITSFLAVPVSPLTPGTSASILSASASSDTPSSGSTTIMLIRF